VFERVNQDVPLEGLHWFIDDAEAISPNNIDRIAALGGGIAVQHRMAYQSEYFVERYGRGAAHRHDAAKGRQGLGGRRRAAIRPAASTAMPTRRRGRRGCRSPTSRATWARSAAPAGPCGALDRVRISTMTSYLTCAAVGLLAGLLYSLIRVRSPAPPAIALIGLLGIVIAQSLVMGLKAW
jgi:XapX domain-containing protein